MPSAQRGTVQRRESGKWAARYRDEEGTQRLRGGFATRSGALSFLSQKLDEVEALRRGDVAALRRREMPTLGELAAEFLGQHSAEPSTVETLRFRLRYALDGPGLDEEGGWRDVRIDRIQPHEVGAWRNRLPAKSAYGVHKALRQVLRYAVRAHLLDENPASLTPNPEPKRSEVQTFTLAELALVADEVSPRFRALPIFAALTGLRPCEWIALERRDVDLSERVVYVRREHVDGETKPYGKTSRSLRAVPLPARAAEALAAHPARIDSRLLFPAARGAYIDLQNWRWREWTPALKAAGIAPRTPYATRHTFASLSIAAGVSLFELSRFMGTSPAMLDKTYGHLLPDALDRGRAALDLFLSAETRQAFGD